MLLVSCYFGLWFVVLSDEHYLLIWADIDYLQLGIVLQDGPQLVLLDVEHILLLHAFVDLVDRDWLVVATSRTDFTHTAHHLGLSVLTTLVVASLTSVTILSCKTAQASEREIHKLKGLVDIIHCDLVAEVEFGHGLRQTNDAQECSWCHVHVALVGGVLSLELTLLNVLRHDVVVQRGWNRWVVGLCVGDECSHDVCVNRLMVCRLTSWSC